jgi:type IV pilus assembly protein PilN
MQLNMNLASQPYEDSRQFWSYWGTGIGLLALITALLVFLAVNGFIEGSHDRQQMAKLKTQLAEFDRERSQAEAMLNQPQNRTVRDQSRFLNELFARKAFSWTLAFEQLEQVMPAHLHVISIHPGISADNNLELKLVVGGETREQALDLVRKMESSKHFRQTRIDTEKFETGNGNAGNNDRVRFDINAFYVPSNEMRDSSGGSD